MRTIIEVTLRLEKQDPGTSRSKIRESIERVACNRRILADLAGELAVEKLDDELKQ
jgi:hypothetical protein